MQKSCKFTTPDVLLSSLDPELKIYQCGLPKEMAIELFKPFLMKELPFVLNKHIFLCPVQIPYHNHH